MLPSSRLLRVALAVLFALLATACSSSVDGAVVAGSDEPLAVVEEPAFEGSGASDGDLMLLTAAEIQAVLAGNTIIGNWVGEEYRQYFAEDGTTTYSPINGAPETKGGWRVNDDTGLYESLWGSATVWDEYEVHQDGDEFFWTGQGVQLSPFTIVSGDQLAGG